MTPAILAGLTLPPSGKSSRRTIPPYYRERITKVAEHRYHMPMYLLSFVSSPGMREQLLAKLAAEEPGENFVNEQYSWSFGQR